MTNTDVKVSPTSCHQWERREENIIGCMTEPPTLPSTIAQESLFDKGTSFACYFRGPWNSKVYPCCRYLNSHSKPWQLPPLHPTTHTNLMEIWPPFSLSRFHGASNRILKLPALEETSLNFAKNTETSLPFNKTIEKIIHRVHFVKQDPKLIAVQTCHANILSLVLRNSAERDFVLAPEC